MARPNWPYEVCMMEEINEPCTELPDHWFYDDYEDTIPKDAPITTLLNSLPAQNPLDTTKGKQIAASITHLVESTLQTIKDNDNLPILNGSYIMPSGSVAEGTKIGEADEFDFNVIITSLKAETVFGLLYNKDNMPQEIVTEEVIRSLFEVIKGVDAILPNIQYCMKYLWMDTMIDIILDTEWDILNPACFQTGKKISATVHLQHKVEKSRVDVDICFWLALKKEDVLTAPPEFVLKEHALINCFQDSDVMYVILAEDEGIFQQFDRIRIGLSLLESKQLHIHGKDNGRIKTYIAAKKLIFQLGIKFHKTGGCCYCEKQLVPSFALKQILFYMMFNHQSDDLWTDNKIADRVYELFTILHFCCVVNYGTIRSFYTPYTIEIRNKFIYNPTIKLLEEVPSCMEQILDEEDQLPIDITYSCIFPNFEDLKKKFDDKVITEILTKYEDFLTNECWMVRDVLSAIFDVLSRLTSKDGDNEFNPLQYRKLLAFGIN